MADRHSIENVVVPVLVFLCGLVLWGALQATCALSTKLDPTYATRIQVAKAR